MKAVLIHHIKAMAKRKSQAKKPEPVKVEEPWIAEELEGQLSVDVYQKGDMIVVKSTIAGVEPDDLEIFLNRDMLTIKGKREHEERVESGDFFVRECYWGKFSRTIILPSDVKSEEARATLKDGVLTVVMPKAQHSRTIPVKLIS
jgi:HSP20 family protein